MADVELKQVKLHFTVKEVMYVILALGALGGHAIRTEIMNEHCQHDLKAVQAEVAHLRDEVQQLRNGH